MNIQDASSISQIKKSENSRFKKANKEAIISLCLYLGYALWWLFCAYGLGSKDPEKYSYVLGFPAWFFYACIVGYPLISLIVWIVGKLCFSEVSLKPYEDEDKE